MGSSKRTPRGPVLAALQDLSQRLGYLGARLGICILQALSLEMCASVASLLSLLFVYVIRLRARLIDENLQHAYPTKSARWRRELARRMWEHLFLMVAEAAHAPRKIHDTNWRDYVELGNQQTMMRALISNRPVLLVTGHFGNFEVGGYILGILGFPTYAIARPLDNPYLDRFVTRFRGITGQYIIPKKGGYDQILHVLKHQGTLSFLADQYAGTKGCWVDFFGRPASVHKAIALLALDHEAPVAVVACRRVGRAMHFDFMLDEIADPADNVPHVRGARELTQWYTKRMEGLIRQNPEQYWWLHRRWRDNRRALKARRAAA